MNDIPTDLVLVAERLSRALVADGAEIERDASARLAAAPPSVVRGEALDVGPSLELDIGANNGTPRRTARSRLVFAVAAVLVVSLAVVVIVSRRDDRTVVTGGGDERYFLPASLPDGYSLTTAFLGLGGSRTPVESWRRVYTQREGGVIRRLLAIETTRPSDAFQPSTIGQPVDVGGHPARSALINQGISIVMGDFGCGHVNIGAVGYGTGSAAPSDLLEDLASIDCAPTSAGGSAAAIAVPRGFTLEVDYDNINAAPRSALNYSHDSRGLSPLNFNFGISAPSPDLTVTLLAGSAKRIKRSGRDYWTAAPLPADSDQGAFVAWNDGPYLVTLSSVVLGLDDLLAVADSVREVDKATFDDVVRPVTIESVPTTTR